ncbi:hypothetical protein AY600_02090 [Phormidium willei BDU 130791]|nr:hypothetical protein AY600_02090 [Phormidium willei BDU 130791]
MTKQEIFDTVVARMRKQGVASYITDDHYHNGRQCMYGSGSMGKKVCAAGALISDDQYTPEMEYKDVYHLRENFGHIFDEDHPFFQHLGFVMELQEWHDKHFSENGWMESTQERLKEIARLREVNHLPAMKGLKYA